MKVTFAHNLGTNDARAFGLDATKCVEGATVDVSPEQHKALIKKYPALFADSSTVRAVATAPAVKAVPEDSPVSDENAAEAIADIGNMRSKEKLQHIIDNDPRVTVKEAAKKRLASL